MVLVFSSNKSEETLFEWFSVVNPLSENSITTEDFVREMRKEYGIGVKNEVMCSRITINSGYEVGGKS